MVKEVAAAGGAIIQAFLWWLHTLTVYQTFGRSSCKHQQVRHKQQTSITRCFHETQFTIFAVMSLWRHLLVRMLRRGALWETESFLLIYCIRFVFSALVT